MSGFSHQDAMARYFELIARHPELGRNAPDADIQILTDPQLIQQACDAAHAARAARNLDVDDLRVGVLASDPYMTIIRDPVQFGNGSLGLYNRIFENRSVAVLPLIGDRAVVIRIFRHGLRQWSLEFPRGGVDLVKPVKSWFGVKSARRSAGMFLNCSIRASLRLVARYWPFGQDFTWRELIKCGHWIGQNRSMKRRP